MEFVLEVFVILLFGVTFGALVWAVERRPAPLELEGNEQERAFTEKIAVAPFDRGQLDRLRPLVSRVGIMRMPGADYGRYGYGDDQYEVYVIDENGVIHDVWVGPDSDRACEIALRLHRVFGVELQDPEAIIARL